MASLIVLLCSISKDLFNVAQLALKYRDLKKIKEYLNLTSIINNLPVYLEANYKNLSISDRLYIQQNMSSEISEAEYAYQDEYDTVSVRIESPEFPACSETVFSCFALQEIKPGMSFIVCGKILPTCERFSINLVIGNQAKDIALHFNPRIPQNYIVRNCRINSAWGKEEVTSPLHFNLHRNDAFTVQIAIMESDFYISVNGRHFAAFRHRLPYNKIKGIEVKGDVKDIQVDQVFVDNYPNLSDRDMLTIKSTEMIKFDNTPKKSLLVPCYGRFEEKFSHGKRLHIKGRIKLLPHSFFINLQEGCYIWPHPNIHFHFNPRFGNVGGKHIVCSNSWLDGKWDKEQRSDCCQFMPGKDFHLIIACEESTYQIYLNEVLITEYRYRSDPKLVDTFYIQGDIQLYSVQMENTCSYN